MKVRPHSLNGAFVAMAIDACSSRSVITWKSSSAVDVHVAELVEAEQIEPPVAADELGQAALIGGLGELVDQAGAGDIADPPAGLRGGDAGADEQVGLAGARVAEQHDGLAPVDPRPGGEGGDGGIADRARGGVELGEVFEPGEAGLDNPAGPAAFVAVVDLGGEDLGEEPAVGEPLLGGLVREPAGFGADGGQVQFPGRGEDRRVRGLFGVGDTHLSAPAASRSS